MLFSCVVAVALFGCVNPSGLKQETQNPKAHRFAFIGCMPYVHTARGRRDIPPALSFVRHVSRDIFLCEYFRGNQLRRYGSFGPALKIKGNKIFAGWGYALSDNTEGLSELVNRVDFATFYTSDSVEFEIVEKILSVGDTQGPFVRTFFVHVKNKYLPITETVAVLGMLSFYEKKRKYRLFLWVQGYHLTKKEVSERFRGMVGNVIFPSMAIAEN
ncbi:MAG: hypothetical protein WD509_01575 [Candidatus Paceibacterota bacterium]